MAEVKITFCNSTYADAWYKNFERQNKRHFRILQAIIQEIQDKDGLDIVKSDLYARDKEVSDYLISHHLNVIPSRGQLLKHNGNGIRHAKFAPSKSIAVVWEKIGENIYITFDDHAPLRYHRAIRHLRDIKLGKEGLPKHPRDKRRFLRKLHIYWKYKYARDLRGINLKTRYYD
jgi:hypothetical protein